jgi:hypothetical protein
VHDHHFIHQTSNHHLPLAPIDHHGFHVLLFFD